MRNAVTLGLLAAALVPLSWDSTSHSQTPTLTSVSALEHETTDAHTGLRNALFEIDRNSEIERSMHRVRKARERTTASRIETGSIDTEAAERAAFAAARNAEIRRSMAAYEAAREARQIATLNREIAASMARAKARREADFTAARNAEARRSLAAYEAARWTRFAELRNREIAASLARAEAYRETHGLRFVALRNAEARRSRVAYETARPDLFAEAYRNELARITARYAKLELAIAREKNESLFATLGRLAPHIATAEAIAGPKAGFDAIETASIAGSGTIGTCPTPSP